MIEGEDTNEATASDESEMELETGTPTLAPGYHIFTDAGYQSGPYESAEDAQAFIDGHLDGSGRVEHVAG